MLVNPGKRRKSMPNPVNPKPANPQPVILKPSGVKGKPLSDQARNIISKLPPADAVAVMEDMMSRVADNNNSNNFSAPNAMTKDEMTQRLQALPDAKLKGILQQHGIV
jgi:hypothetical protein